MGILTSFLRVAWRRRRQFNQQIELGQAKVTSRRRGQGGRSGPGREAVARGRSFEALIEMANNYYRSRGLARIEHYGPAIKVLGKRRGRLEVIIVGKAPPDYVGLVSDGSFVAFEAKSNSAKERVTITKRLHQFDALLEMAEVAGSGDQFGYIHLWQKRPVEEQITWHPISGLGLEGHPRKLVLIYEEGIVVPPLPGMAGMGGVPDWLAVVVSQLYREDR